MDALIKLNRNRRLSIPILVLLIQHLVSISIKPVVANSDWFYLLVLLSIVLFLNIFKYELKKSILSFIILILSLITYIDNDVSNLTGVMFFLWSLSVSIKSFKTYLVYFLIFISAISYKFTILNAESYQIISYLSGVSFLFIFYFQYIHKSKEALRLDIYNKEIDPDIIKAVLYYIQNYTWDENPIAIKKQIGGRHLRNMITKQYYDMGFKNITQFAYYICEMQNRTKLDKNKITE